MIKTKTIKRINLSAGITVVDGGGSLLRILETLDSSRCRRCGAAWVSLQEIFTNDYVNKVGYHKPISGYDIYTKNGDDFTLIYSQVDEGPINYGVDLEVVEIKEIRPGDLYYRQTKEELIKVVREFTDDELSSLKKLKDKNAKINFHTLHVVDSEAGAMWLTEKNWHQKVLRFRELKSDGK